MNAPIRWRVAIFAALALTTSTAFGQRGGFSPDRMFDMLDRDQSGVIEPEEIENSPMGRMVDRMGLDTSRGITRDDLSNSMDQMRRRMEEGGFGGRGGSRGGFGGWGRGFGGDDNDEERDDDERRGWWSRGGDEDDGDGDSRRGSSRDRSEGRRGGRNSSRSTSTKPAEPPRVTLDLPAQFAAGDADGDGQIGMYEWTKWKSRAALAEFLGLDRNGDGFLTPRELARAHEAKPVDLATALPIGPAATQNQTAVLSVEAANAASPQDMMSPHEITRPSEDTSLVSLAEDDQAAIAAADEKVIRKAKYDFSLLDSNRDGVLSELEWRFSKTLKPRFEKAGVDLAQPMSSDQFVSHYVRIVAADGSS